ncbi:hypothetical protein Mgra_00000467 [Meloidogyne graminicola]|uniref:Uncharacterized protein n=1 Tax=Meloidogyne graminicola TaxID=189291 RepID=A0A8T0A3A2_9BILA|nr:hypothetical protein Mgra_00000467 [Meloidogyne graminicola]
MFKITKKEKAFNKDFCLQKRLISTIKNNRNSQKIFKSSLCLFTILFIFLNIFLMVKANKNEEINNNQIEQSKNIKFIKSNEEEKEEQLNNNNNLFQAYLSRGMFGCAAKHVSILQKLNKLIASAHQEYAECQSKMDNTAKSLEQSRKLDAQLEIIGDLFNDD